MREFRVLVFCALISGLIAGLILSLLQHYTVIPLIMEAETFELASQQPDNGFERTSLTVLSNVLAGVGFALLLSAGNYLHGQYSIVKGLLWGIAGYLIFFVAPALGLPPELPGTASAALEQRQTWWLFTILATGTGLATISFSRKILFQLLALLLIISPHLYGAPQPQIAESLAGEDLEHQFIIATTLANALFWLILGAVNGYGLKRCFDR